MYKWEYPFAETCIISHYFFFCLFSILLQFNLLKLLDSLFKVADLLVSFRKLLLISFTDGLGGSVLVCGVAEDLLLLLNGSLGLLKLLLSLGNLSIHVDAALDMQEDRGNGRDGVRNRSRRASGISADNLDLADGLASKGSDGGDLLSAGNEGRAVVSLDDNFVSWLAMLSVRSGIIM